MKKLIDSALSVIRLMIWQELKLGPAETMWARANKEECFEECRLSKEQCALIRSHKRLFYNTFLAEYPDIFDSEELFSRSRAKLLNYILKSFKCTFPFTYYEIDNFKSLPYTNDVLDCLDYMDTFDIPIKVQRHAILHWKEMIRELIKLSS